MTLALIVLVVFLIVWFFDSAKKKEEKQAQRKQTITNVKHQDELWCENYKKVINDLRDMDPIDGITIMQKIETLFAKYDIPDPREESEKHSSQQAHLRKYKESIEEVDRRYEDSCLYANILGEGLPTKKVPSLEDCIWYYPWTPPNIDKPELLFGKPNTSVTIDGTTYKYDANGRATNASVTEPAALISMICNLLTIRALDGEGFNYSWNRRESFWQQSEANVKAYQDNKTKYPWLYK